MTTAWPSHAHSHSIVEIGSAGRALGGGGEGGESGDLHVVVPFEDGALLAVIDGLGHGPEAADAAGRAGEVLAAHAGEPILALVQRCHEALRRTRGAVMSLVSFSCRDSAITWTGVGNVEGTLLRARYSTQLRREAIATRGGVVGYQLPPLRAESLPVARGDTLILVTDGIRSGYTADLALERSPQELAEAILAAHDKGTDDSLVVVARYLGRDLVADVLAAPAARVFIHEEADVSIARKHARQLARDQGMAEAATEAMATAVSEIAHNIVKYGESGEIAFASVAESGRRGVMVVARDDGPGIADPDIVLTDGYSTGEGLGLGLSSARRLMDEFELRSEPGRGTTIAMTKWAQ